MEEIVYLEIAGFIIALRLHKSAWPFFTEKAFRDRVFILYGGFVLNEKPNKKNDYIIDLVYNQFPEVIIQTQKRKNFIEFFVETKQKNIVTFYHVGDAQFILILRKVVQQLIAKNKAAIIHGSGVLINNKAYIFVGKSGAGKSTVMQFLASKYLAIADDSVIIKEEDKSFFLYQTPFKEAQEWVIKKIGKYPLGGIFFIKKTKFNKIEKIADKEYLANILLEQFFTEYEHADDQIKRILRLVAKFNNFYLLSFGLQEPLEVVKLFDNID